MSAVEALYIFNEHNTCILEHVWNGRPPAAQESLARYLEHSAPRPPLIYAIDINPSSLIFSIIHDRLLFLSPSSKETDPLAVVEFLHKVADAFEDFLGSPLLASKIESSYDVVTQLLGEMCDGGMIATTETNALKEVVEAPNWMRSLLGGVGLPSSPPSAMSPTLPNLPRLSSFNQTTITTNNITVPWRRSNVRHTSNEMYVDLVETLHVTVAPSGRPLAAFAHGTIVFTCKVSGVPDLLLILSGSGGSKSLASSLKLPVFHPCVRLTRWKEHPGELSFVPPDGKFLLGGYEVDLLAPDYIERSLANPKTPSGLQLPASIDVRTQLGSTGAEFEVKLILDPKFTAKPTISGGGGVRDAITKPGSLGAKTSGTSANPTVEDIIVRIPVGAGVRNMAELRASKGEAQYIPTEQIVEWRITLKDTATMGGTVHSSAASVVATLRCTVVGDLNQETMNDSTTKASNGNTWDYDDGASTTTYQSTTTETHDPDQSTKLLRANKALMPTSATVSFQVKGWLASGVKVEKLSIDSQRSRGLGAGVQPYKGVKYLTVSDGGIELRC